MTEVIIDPEEVKADPAAWACIGAEETRLIDYSTARQSWSALKPDASISKPVTNICRAVSREKRSAMPSTSGPSCACSCTTAVCNRSEAEIARRRLPEGRARQIDNNLTENAIRPSAIGKKNWLFMGDAQSGDRAAAFYTLIGNCHREGIDAIAYLTDIFTRLPSETNQTVHRLTPKAWAAEQAALLQAVAQTCVAAL
ncbi:MAG: transposase [Prosthecobacter sp.]|nr:transposase [Prosthecobacter sp.]